MSNAGAMQNAERRKSTRILMILRFGCSSFIVHRSSF
jgi:hypothetical protein